MVIKRGINSCETSGIEIFDHFREVTKMVLLGRGRLREPEKRLSQNIYERGKV